MDPLAHRIASPTAVRSKLPTKLPATRPTRWHIFAARHGAALPHQLPPRIQRPVANPRPLLFHHQNALHHPPMSGNVQMYG